MKGLFVFSKFFIAKFQKFPVSLFFEFFVLFEMVTNTLMQRLVNWLRDTLFFFYFLNHCWFLIVTWNLLLRHRSVKVILFFLNLNLFNCFFNQSLDLGFDLSNLFLIFNYFLLVLLYLVGLLLLITLLNLQIVLTCGRHVKIFKVLLINHTPSDFNFTLDFLVWNIRHVFKS